MLNVDEKSCNAIPRVLHAEAMHKYESTNEGIIADRNINTGIDNTSSASDNDITGMVLYSFTTGVCSRAG